MLARFYRKFSDICETLEIPANAHVTLKFLGHSSEYLTEKRILGFIPEISEIANKFTPINVYVKGFSTFTYDAGKSPVIFLKILPNDKLSKLHKTICENFKDRVDYFPHADGENFQPHITISKNLKSGKEKKLAQIISRGHKMKKRMIKLSDLVILTPNRMFHVTKEPDFSNICPPID